MDMEKLVSELEEKKRRGSIMKKKIITVAIATALISAYLFGVTVLINMGWFTETVAPQAEWYEFAPITDFNYDVMKDSWYKNQLDIGPIVKLNNAQTGVGIELPEEQYGEHGEAVRLLTNLVIAAQKGDNDAYNACFSDAYLIEEGKKKAALDAEAYAYADTDAEYLELGKKSEFTMQQVYDVVITMYSEEKNNEDLLYCTYELKYKIHMNNGTLRNDMGSDCYRVQQIIMLENGESGELEIITVNTFSDRTEQDKIVLYKALIAVFVSAVFIAAVVVVAVRNIKKTRTNEVTEDKTDCKEKNV